MLLYARCFITIKLYFKFAKKSHACNRVRKFNRFRSLALGEGLVLILYHVEILLFVYDTIRDSRKRSREDDYGSARCVANRKARIFVSQQSMKENDVEMTIDFFSSIP